jgi:hypothetical protein
MNNEREQVPAICLEVGLSCKRCAEDSATSLASVCKGLRPKAVIQLFHQIYPHSACAPMSSYFAKSYRAASKEVLGLFADKELRESKKPCVATTSREPRALGVRKEVTSTGLRTMEAVA